MAIAETAQLAVNLTLGGNFTGGLASAESSLGRFNATAATSGAKTGVLSGAFTTVERGAARMGGALSHAGGQIKGLITGPLGLIGLTGGLLSFGGAIGSTLGKLNDLAFGTEKLIALTGGSAQTLSTLIAASEKYGISLDKLTVTAGFYEKNVDKVIGKNKDLAKVLTDATGKALPFDQALLAIADVYSKSTDKAQAAAIAASLFGRSYTGLVPILALGRQGILDLETEAAKMGLQLSGSNVADFAKYRDAIRGSQEAISGLQVAIGIDLLPTIIDLANGLRSFVTTHKGDILNFVNGLVSAARTAASAVGAIVGGLQSAWNAIPPELRDFLVKGLVADRTVKFLFGFSPIGSIVGGIEKAIGSAVAAGVAKGAITAGIGKLFVQPVFVTNPGFGAGGGLPNILPEAGAAAGGLSLGAIAVGLTAVTAFGVAVGMATKAIDDAIGVTPGNLRQDQWQRTIGNLTGPSSFRDSTETRAAQTVASALIQFRADERASLTATHELTDVMRHAPWLSKLEESWRKAGQTMHDKIAEAIKGLTGPNAGAAAGFLGTHLGQAGFGAGGIKQATEVLAILKSMKQSPDVVAAIARLERQLPRLKLDLADLRKAEEIAQNSDPKNKKLDALNAIMADLRAHGDKTTQHKVADLITAVKHQKFTVVAPINIRVTGGGGEAGRTVNRTVSRSGEWVAV